MNAICVSDRGMLPSEDPGYAADKGCIDRVGRSERGQSGLQPIPSSQSSPSNRAMDEIIWLIKKRLQDVYLKMFIVSCSIEFLHLKINYSAPVYSTIISMYHGIGWAGKDPPGGASGARGRKDTFVIWISVVAPLWLNQSSNATSKGFGPWTETQLQCLCPCCEKRFHTSVIF